MATLPSTDPAAVVPIRKAASVLLLRPAETGFEVFVQHRVSTMDFAAGMVVYPGGRVDAQDAMAAEELPTEILDAHAAAWNNSREQAGEVLAAARREVFEETGLLLDPHQLQPWANWITPAGFPKRFNTYFFVAQLAPGQEPRHQTTEAVISRWINPTALFEAAERGELKMMRPTQRTLIDAMELGSLAQIFGAQRIIRTVHPDPNDTNSATPIRDYELSPRD